MEIYFYCFLLYFAQDILCEVRDTGFKPISYFNKNLYKFIYFLRKSDLKLV